MKTTNTVLHAIAELNLEPIKNKLMDAQSGEGWSRAKADAMDLEYRRFLHLMYTFPNEAASPTIAVDTFWHYHILDTQKYAADCDQVFGCFMHHDPYGAEPDEAAGATGGDRMQELYEATFGVAYIRAEAYCVDQPTADLAGGADAQAASAAGKSGAAPGVCQGFCMWRAKPASEKPEGAKAGVCQGFCMWKAKPASEKPAGAKAGVCQGFCMWKAKPASAKPADAKAGVCQGFCMWKAKPASDRGAIGAASLKAAGMKRARPAGAHAGA